MATEQAPQKLRLTELEVIANNRANNARAIQGIVARNEDFAAAYADADADTSLRIRQMIEATDKVGLKAWIDTWKKLQRRDWADFPLAELREVARQHFIPDSEIRHANKATLICLLREWVKSPAGVGSPSQDT